MNSDRPIGLSETRSVSTSAQRRSTVVCRIIRTVCRQTDSSGTGSQSRKQDFRTSAVSLLSVSNRLMDEYRLTPAQAHLLPCFSSCVGKMWVVSSKMWSRLRAASWLSLLCSSRLRRSSSSPRRRLWRSILSRFSWWRPARRCSRWLSSWERRRRSLSAGGGGGGTWRRKTLHHHQWTTVQTLTALHLLVAPSNRLLQLLNLHLTGHDLPFLRGNSCFSTITITAVTQQLLWAIKTTKRYHQTCFKYKLYLRWTNMF